MPLYVISRKHTLSPCSAPVLMLACSTLVAFTSPAIWAKSPISTPTHTSHTADVCTTCHQPTAGFSHPVEIIPSMTIPDDFPLDDTGKMTCLTCHKSQRSSQFGVSHGALRVEKTGPALCAQCHDSNSASRQNMHARSIASVHLMWDRGSPTASSTNPDSKFPPKSDRCLSCHDGSVATDIGHRGMNRGEIASVDVLAASHPVDIPYRQADPRSADGPLVPSLALDSRITLPQGNVTCISCHSPYSKEHAQLVISNLGSRLCLSCHQY